MTSHSAGISLGNAPTSNPLPVSVPPARTSSASVTGDPDTETNQTDSAPGLPTPGSSVVTSSASPSLMSTATASASAAIGTTSHNESTLSPGAIVGILIAALATITLVLFFIRRHFVQRRTAKITPARSRISRLVISGPTNFQHLESGDQNANTSQYPTNAELRRGHTQPAAAAVGPTSPGWNPASTFAPPMQTELQRQEGSGVWATSQSPSERIQRKYTVNFGNLESGLNDHLETMRGARKVAPHI